MVLKNIDWESIGTAKTWMAKTVRFAELWASKIETKLAGGMSFDHAVDQALGDAKLQAEVDEKLDLKDMVRHAVGLIYATWDQGDKFKEYWLRHHGQDLQNHSLIERADPGVARLLPDLRNPDA